MYTQIIQNIFRIILGLFMLISGIGHLSFQREEFLAQVPRWLPNEPGFMDFVVVSSGVVEIVFGLAMIFLGRYKVWVGILLAVFYVLIFPGNISQYANGIDGFGLDTDQKRLIRLFFQPVLILWALWSTGAYTYIVNYFKERREAKSKSFYDFEAVDIRGKLVRMSDFKDKTVVVVNTASKCGLTPQYEGLEKLYQQHKEEGLVILGFPCNQFANQESGSSNEIESFCQVIMELAFRSSQKSMSMARMPTPYLGILRRHLVVFRVAGLNGILQNL